MKTDLKILLLEDSEDDIELILRQLKKEGLECETFWVDSREEFIKGLHSFKPDVILSDHSLPQFNSLEALKISQRKGFRHTPFILVTGTVSEEFAVDIIKKGASDYILKSNLVKLSTAILKALEKRNNHVKRIHAELRIRKQNEELLKINKELDNFVYDISHNLRGPLMSLLGLINISKYEEDKNKSSFLNYFVLMEKSVSRLDKTLEHILDYSRNSRKNLCFKEIDLANMINDLYGQLKYTDDFDKSEKITKIENVVPFYSDSYRLSVILLNLFSNSIKYRDTKKEKSFIKLIINVDSEKATIHFEDNGIGIEEGFQDKVFGMFFRATEKSTGAGLGLYIVKEMIQKLQGEITLSSKENIGTTFKLTIPNAPNGRL